MSIPDIVTVDIEDSFGIFMPDCGGYDIKAINPDGSISATLVNFDDYDEARALKHALTEHVRFWTKVGI